MESEFDRRRVLAAGGLLSLSAVLAACTGGRSASPRPSAAPAAPSSVPPSALEPPPPPPAPAPPSAVALLNQAGRCTLTPATIAGPTWFDADALRSDVRDGQPGVPLDLAFRVERTPSCQPLAGAVVDLWQCDALGVYSGFAHVAPGDGGNPGRPDQYGDAQSVATSTQRFLRGTQSTGPDGVVTFRSIYPGWYPTRTAHLHLKVHLDRTTVLTTQLFFDDAVSDAVYAGFEPYRQHRNRDTRNARDPFYKPSAQLRLAEAAHGWLGAIILGVR